MPVDQLERLDELLWAARQAGGASLLSDQARESLGWTEAEAAQVLKALGFTRGRGRTGADAGWKARKPSRAAESAPPKHSPFAALAALKPAEPRRDRRPRKRRPKAPKAAS